MRIPKYWARANYKGKDQKGCPHTFIATGWSFISIQEARDEASARAKRIFESITAGRKPERYEYHDRPIQEEVLKEIRDGDVTIAVVTRNRYGALILNCTNALFVDVDFPRPQSRGLLDNIMLAFSRKRRQVRQQAAAKAKIDDIAQWAHRHRDRSFRLYRTKEGLRLLFTDRLYDPIAKETENLMSELQADPLYMTLTRKQECFRARLTSKPWRCGISRPPNSFPWDDSKAEADFRKWEATYMKHDAEFKVCDLIREFGKPATVESLKSIIDVHDRESRVTADTELA